MAATGAADPLLTLRQAIAAGTPVVPTATDDADAAETPLPQAKFLQFGTGDGDGARTALAVDAPTRFLSGEAPVDLRSIYFAWINREVAIPDYIAAATRLNEELAAAGSSATVHKFAFVERLDLITWLEGASEESEYITSAVGARVGGATGSTAPGATAAGTGSTGAAPSTRAGRGVLLDPRLAVIYGGERRTGDHNTALRGIKPTDFSHVRKLAVQFMSKKQQAAGAAADKKLSSTLPLNPKAGAARRPDPIILLSPSASSLLRMSNIKAFLETGRYTPPDNSSTATMLHLTRTLKEIDPARPLRFILVEGPEQFKPEYWNRVVAVFTTGQAWQFKNYKWSNPSDLFRNVQGVYVGWRGEAIPPGVRDWGHRVLSLAVDKWTDPSVPGAETHRWRDREVAESIWKAIEAGMLQKGWKRNAGAPGS